MPVSTKSDQETDPVAAPKSVEQPREPVVQPDQEMNLRPVSTTGNTLTVGCKVPSGLKIQLCKMVEFHEPVMGGGTRKVMIAERYGPQITLNGFANHHGVAPRNLTYGGFAMTYGVPQDFFELWLEQNKDSDLVEKGLVFALPKTNDALRLGKERQRVVSGMEPVDPTKKMRMGAFEVEEAVV